MSGADGENDASLVPYKVGYAKPPEDSRFKKGNSGNPLGRPRKSKSKKPKWDPVLRPTDSLILEEAYRPVTIREGDKSIELPAIQASTRALAISAMKGSRLAQKQLSEIVRSIEARRNTEHLETLEAVIEYKQQWTAELQRRERLGIIAPDPVPHPNDIFIDLISGNIEVEGPMNDKQKAFWDERYRRMTEAQEEVSAFAQRHRNARDRGERPFGWMSGTLSSGSLTCSMTLCRKSTNEYCKIAPTPRALPEKGRRSMNLCVIENHAMSMSVREFRSTA